LETTYTATITASCRDHRASPEIARRPTRFPPPVRAVEGDAPRH
jgi:hypothetical protein